MDTFIRHASLIKKQPMRADFKQADSLGCLEFCPASGTKRYSKRAMCCRSIALFDWII